MSEEATLDEFVGEESKDTVDVGSLQQLEESPISEWTLNKLGSLLTLEYGDNLPSDSREVGEIPVFGSNGQVDTHSEPAINEPGIIMGRKGSIGEIEFSEHPFWPIDTTYYLTRNETDENLRFLYYLLQNIQLERLNAASAIPGLNRNDAYGLNALVPPLPEQRQIATVLYMVDRAIEKTEEIIEQVERTKKALTQRLFLDGYFEHSETVDAYHQNRLPRHPTEWQTKPAGEVMEVTRGAHPRPKSDDTLWRGKIPIIKIGDRNRGDSRTITSTDDTVTEKGSKKSKLVDEGTLIVSNAGTVGTARITGMQTCIHDHWLILRDYEESLSTRYLYYFINWNQGFLEALASGSTVLDLNTDDFRLFDVTFPRLEEQQKIADTLDSLHNRKMVNIEYSDRLKRLKRGLMQDLLSGTVRTTDTNIEVPEEIAKYG